jgi:uncharacterized protein (TIGR02246 family)
LLDRFGMLSRSNFSSRSWAAFAVSCALLLIFAIAGVQQFRNTRGNQESTGQTAPVEGQTQTAKDAANQAKDIAPQVWEPSIKNAPAPESTIKELVQAWNKRDSEMIAALFLPDGVLRIPTGSEIRSREEIKNAIAKHQNGMLSDTTLTNTVEGISKADEDNVVVKGTYQLDGIKVLGFSTKSQGTFEIRQMKREGRWLIAKAEVTRE